MDPDLHFLLHTLWSKAVKQNYYDKQEWVALQQAIFALQGSKPPVDYVEPKPWNGVNP